MICTNNITFIVYVTALFDLEKSSVLTRQLELQAKHSWRFVGKYWICATFSELLELERFQTAEVTIKVTTGH